jgi:hypothetical protein
VEKTTLESLTEHITWLTGGWAKWWDDKTSKGHGRGAPRLSEEPPTTKVAEEQCSKRPEGPE